MYTVCHVKAKCLKFECRITTKKKGSDNCICFFLKFEMRFVKNCVIVTVGIQIQDMSGIKWSKSGGLLNGIQITI